MLEQLGIISGFGTKDKDKKQMDRASGWGQYKFNTSAYKRFLVTCFDAVAAEPQDGDTVVNYDWAQPIAFTFGGGASAAEATKLNYKDALGMIANAMEQSTTTLTEHASHLKRVAFVLSMPFVVSWR
jgi:hypothetical protein